MRAGNESGNMTGIPLHILMGVRNGAAHLPDQLASIARQRGVRWHLTCSDDGSYDQSREIVAGFQQKRGAQVTLTNGPEKGFAANYMQMIAGLPPSTGPVALADQDDIWMPDKLRRALDWLSKARDGRPALYCARRWVWDGANHLHPGPDRYVRRTGFRNALIENIASGNTIVLNPAAAALARDMAPRSGPVFAHDWWLYLLIAGAGGQVFADPGRVLLYRQHAGNTIGAGHGLNAQCMRKLDVLRGVFGLRITGNVSAMHRCRSAMTTENRVILDRFAAARQAGFAVRLAGLREIAPYRQTRTASATFWGAAALGRA